MGLREDKKEATRAALSWAAVRLIVQRGFDNVLVEDIAAAAGVSPRTFNNYFSSKGEAIAARHLDRYLQMVDNLRARPDGEPFWDSIRAAVVGVVQRPPSSPFDQPHDPTSDDRERWFAGVRTMSEHPALQAEFLRAGARAQEALTGVIAQRTGAQDLYPQVAAAAILAAINAAMNQWQAGRNPAARDTDAPAVLTSRIIEALTLLSDGLPPPQRQGPDLPPPPPNPDPATLDATP
ncbi:TetR family transcriptional regulator [Actinoplanes sp. NPDC049265]|uniref:TetR family transcriptional regulator n=1 Tax=Actinoplanes sp. NPDC049265 TaxID=3363902 RepID=UPI00371E8251